MKKPRRLRMGLGMKITLVQWSAAEESEERTQLRRQSGYKVILQDDPRGGPAILGRLRTDPAAAVVIDLDRLPMQGRDLGVVAGLVDHKAPALDADWSGLLFASRRERETGKLGGQRISA